MRNKGDGISEPSARTNVALPMKSVELTVPALYKVIATSTGIDTSAAPLSIVNFSFIELLIMTGTRNVPLSYSR
jgi:hypothetical protein